MPLVPIVVAAIFFWAGRKVWKEKQREAYLKGRKDEREQEQK